MRTRSLRTITPALLVVLAACGCSATSGSSGSGKKTNGRLSGPTYRQAMDAMYPDTLSAMKATMPAVRPEEDPGSTRDCGGADVLDGKDASRRIASAIISMPGDPSDTRTPATLVGSVANRLRGLGWRVEKRHETSPAGHPDGVITHLKNPGTRGTVSVSAYPFRLSSGKISQTLVANVDTDCLRNQASRNG
ncbi:hypothetical protein [Streptomyces sp. NPDC088725]|uniref:hypothetical protein n=1 Tax=Streptomyces sp. NPDC088725 TaxID=3365873 RepID=UPI0038291B05